MEQAEAEGARIPIGAVVRRTGLSAHVLRAWERRYAVVEPVRSEGGVRLYTNEDVLRLRLLRRVTEAGHAIGRVAALASPELLALVRDDEAGPAAPESGARATEAGHYLAATLEAIEGLDGPRVHAVLMRAMVGLDSREFLDGLVVPLLRRVGELWAEEAICPAHERLLSVNLRRVLAWVIEAVPLEAGAPVVVSTTPSEQRHELGAMLAGVVAAEEGWRVVYLGPDLPAPDIASAVRVTGATVVALSVVYGGERGALRAQVAWLREVLPAEVLLVVGGSGAQGAGLDELGAVVLRDLDALRALLRSRRTADSHGPGGRPT